MFFDNATNLPVIDALNELYNLATGGVGLSVCEQKLQTLLPDLAAIIEIPAQIELNEAFFLHIKEVLNDSTSL